MILEWIYAQGISKEAMKKAEDPLNQSSPSTITKSLSELPSMNFRAFS